MKEITAVVLGGGEGKRLFPLTKWRSKPAVPLAGKYRLIDVPVSNCINSNISRIYVLTMFQSASLNAHISSTYRFDHFSSGFVSILAAEQTSQGGSWYRGTADAVRQAWPHINSLPTPYVLILSGDHLYRMNYVDFKRTHMASGAAASIAVKPVSRDEAAGLGILRVNAEGRVVAFVEKPTREDVLEGLRTDTTQCGLSRDEAQFRPYLANMGVYLFDSLFLQEVLGRDNEQTDFGRHIIPRAISEVRVQAHCFKGYWADIGTVGNFYDCNMDLVHALPRFNLFDPGMPIYTHPRFLPGAKVNRASIEGAILCEGTIVEGAVVRDSILGVRARVRPAAIIENSLIMGADYYQSGDSLEPRVGIGEGAHIRRAIVDKNASVGRGAQLVNREFARSYDDPDGRFYVRDGVIVVVKGGVIPDGFVF
ncbi:MAG: glucose-1-phosphate adenylyltransferase [Candidatus Eisenbacteria bacterium]|nr:glucose-1-phosphate adenylyltransferase [Candidatus Eisenbacteria bacterium]